LEGEHRAAPELDAEVDLLGDDACQGEHEQERRQPVPQPLPADEVDLDLAAVQAAPERAKPGHQVSPGTVVAREDVLRPMRSRSSPDSLCPSAKNLTRASRATSGLVNKNTTTMSMSVVSPIANANPATPPTA